MIKLNYILLLFLIILCFSCSNDDAEKSKAGPKYVGEHSLFVDKIEASGFGAIMVTGTFNISYDPSILEVGFILTNNQDNTETKKTLNLEQLHAKETIIFGNLSDGNYSVKAYLINGNSNEICSQNKSISLITNLDSDYSLSCLSDYINKNGNPVLIVNNDDYVLISLVCKNPLVSEKVYIKLSDKIFEMNFVESTGWTDGLWHYYIDGHVAEEMPEGEHEIEIIFQDQVSFNTGIVLDKLPGKWEQLNSLYTGELKSGTKISFQSEKYGFLVQNEIYYALLNEFQVWRMNFSSLQWRKMSSLKLPEYTYISESYPIQITNGDKAYVIFKTVFDPYDWSGDETYYLEIWEYNMTTDTWSQKMKIGGEFPHDPIAFSHKKKFYVVGGRYYDAEKQIDILSDKQWIYDIENNVVNESKNPTNMIETYDGSYYSSFESEKYSYIISSSYSGWKYKILRFSEKNNLFENLESPYVMMSGMGIGYTFNNKIYYVGGRSDYGSHFYCYTFSEDSNKWQQIADFPFRISEGIVFKFNSKAYVGLGDGFYDTKISLFSLK
ncbi:MAG: Kelch repeat type 1-containing protein [Bacteroidetes bacterium]|nr:Kelch repeat type 1-containing protein [Bacteroidota bacterium]